MLVLFLWSVSSALDGLWVDCLGNWTWMHWVGVGDCGAVMHGWIDECGAFGERKSIAITGRFWCCGCDYQ